MERRYDRVVIWLGSALLLIGGGGVAVRPLPAQTALPTRLAVQPRSMATGTHTGQAGRYALDSISKGLWAYVPHSCVGTRRCPLIVLLDVDRDSLDSVADQYGMIVLGLASVRGGWAEPPNLRIIEAVLRHVLRTFAIDPDKIALVISNGGEDPDAVVGDNLHVFSRIVVLEAVDDPTIVVDPPNQTTEFLLLSRPATLRPATLREGFASLQEMRRAGHRVKLVFYLAYDDRVAVRDYIGRWLHGSWATPDPAARPAPRVLADSLPLLTPDMLTRMAAFATHFTQGSDSVSTARHLAYQQEIVVPVGQDRPSVVMMDTPALAAKDPSVAAALKAAGLTAEQHDIYRVALLSAEFTKAIEARVGPVDPASTLWKNVEFIGAARNMYDYSSTP